MAPHNKPTRSPSIALFPIVKLLKNKRKTTIKRNSLNRQIPDLYEVDGKRKTTRPSQSFLRNQRRQAQQSPQQSQQSSSDRRSRSPHTSRAQGSSQRSPSSNRQSQAQRTPQSQHTTPRGNPPFRLTPGANRPFRRTPGANRPTSHWSESSLSSGEE